jgi:transglutaminase-like putative cysteine protease
MQADANACLAPTAMVDSDAPTLRAYALEHSAAHHDPRSRAVALYYAVRDGIRYDPYGLDLSVNGLRASTTLAAGRGWCVPKAVLLAAACRAIGIPAALGYADVRNHLSTARMRQQMQTDVFYWHGYTAILLDGRWVKATPAFNIELCEKFRIRALEFDGREDSIYHPLDLDGRQHMEYLSYRGEFADVPLAPMVADFRRYYPGVSENLAQGDFERDVNIETDGHV